MQIRLKAILVSLGLSTAPALAQPPVAQPPAGITLHGSWRLRGESWDWFNPSGGFDDNYTFGGSTLRLGIGQQKQKIDWQIEFLQATLLHLPENAVAPAPQGQLGLGGAYFANNAHQDGTAFLKQAFVRWKGVGAQDASLQLGRFTFSDGIEVLPKDPTLLWLKRNRLMERLIGIGNVTFTHVQQSLDGVQWTRNAPSFNLTLLAFRPTEGIVRLAGWKSLHINSLYGVVTIPLRGPQDKNRPDGLRGDVRLFVLNTRDPRDVVKTDNRPLAARQADGAAVNVTTLGGSYVGAWPVGAGTVDALAWGGLQRGDWGRLAQKAWAGSLETGYQLQSAAWKPWLRLGWTHAGGDNDPDDRVHRTFFPHFTARLYARFPFFTDLMNNDDQFAQLILRPSQRLDIRLDAHRLRLSQKADLWYSGAGAFDAVSFGYGGKPSGGHKNLAHLFDLSAGYKFSPRATGTLYLSQAVGGDVVRSVYPRGSRARFFYAELARTF